MQQQIAAIEFMERENLPARARKIGEIVQARFKRFYEKYNRIGDVRGLGAMMAIEFVKDRES